MPLTFKKNRIMKRNFFKMKILLLIVFIVVVSCTQKQKDSIQQKYGLSPAEEDIGVVEYALNKQRKLLVKNQFSDESIDEALKVVNEIIPVYPDSVRYLIFKGKMLLWKEQYHEYILFCQENMQKYKNKAGIKGSIGHCYYLMGDSTSANQYFMQSIETYDEQLKKDKGNSHMMFNRAFMFNFTEGKEKAIQELERYRKEYPDDFHLNGPIHMFYEFDKNEYYKELAKKGAGLY